MMNHDNDRDIDPAFWDVHAPGLPHGLVSEADHPDNDSYPNKGSLSPDKETTMAPHRNPSTLLQPYFSVVQDDRTLRHTVEHARREVAEKQEFRGPSPGTSIYP
jgi:hypothetical protein